MTHTNPSNDTVEPKQSRWLMIARVLALVAVIAITVAVFMIRDRAEEFAAYGYPGIFLLALISNATVLVPAPGLAVVFAMGAIFNPIGIALAAGAGGAIGELSGYLAGFSGQAVIERYDIYERFYRWMEKYGGPAVMILASIPNPFFDAAGIAAGALKMPVYKFLFWCWIGVTIKMLLFAYLGSSSLKWLLE